MSKKHMVRSSRSIGISASGPIVARAIRTETGHEITELQFDYSRAKVPDRFYYADYCHVQEGRAVFSLFFGKVITGTPKLRTKVEVVFPREMFVRQLWRSSREFHERIRPDAEKLKLPPLENIEDTDKIQTFSSNNVFMGKWGEESVMDFFYLSPRDLHFARMGKQGNVALEPVVRIVLSTPLLFEFLEKCKPLAEALSTEYGDLEASHVGVT